MKTSTIARLGLLAAGLTLLAACSSTQTDSQSNMSVMSDKSQCAEKKDCCKDGDKAADKASMSVMSEKKECTDKKACCSGQDKSKM